MKIPALPFTVTDWSQVAAATHPGESGPHASPAGPKRMSNPLHQVSNLGDAAHRSSTRTGARLFIVIVD